MQGQSEAPAKMPVSPVKLAHFVLRTSKFDEMAAWYKRVLGAKPAFEDGNLAFLSYDEEHHRIALVNMPELAPQSKGTAGVHHVAFTYASLADLLTTYEALSNLGIEPVWPVNHGPTTSIYYRDPDGNQLEFQVENFDTLKEADAFFRSSAFAINPIGVDFDPDELLARLRSGEPESELKKRPDSGPRALETVPLH